VTVAQLTAPYTPFVADEIFTNLTASTDGAVDSVHLSDWPALDETARDDGLRKRMALVRRLVGLGRAARTDAKVRVRQPLERALVVLPATESADLEGLEGLVAEELNVRTVELARGVGELVSYTVKPNFKALGPRFGSRVKKVADSIGATDAASLVEALERDGSVHLDVDGEQVTLAAEDVDVRVEGRSGFSFAQDGPYGVALDVEITPELRAEGIAREIVRAVQDLRKSAGLAVEDRIELWLSADDTSAIEEHRGSIANETLATSVTVGLPDGDASSGELQIEGQTVSIALRKAG
jgi:isoleucyl-tRNA synthetase